MWGTKMRNAQEIFLRVSRKSEEDPVLPVSGLAPVKTKMGEREPETYQKTNGQAAEQFQAQRLGMTGS